jgi:membrane glycosyltransferase
MNLWKVNLKARRALVLGLTFLTSVAASGFLLGALLYAEMDLLDWVAGAAFGAIMVAGSFNFWLYVLGFSLSRSHCDPPGLEKIQISSRTAVVMPLYNEDMDRVWSGVRQTWLSMKAAGLELHCDFYLLCDSTEESKRMEEDQCYERLLRDFDHNYGEVGRLFLIRRAERTNYKAGNIANFLEHHGAAYDYMLVLDADSVMLGGKVKRLIQLMQCRKHVAVLQSMIIPIGASTPFARVMQFTNARSLPLFGCGLYWFLGRDSVYWGHNAIIRIEPFCEHCNLPIMPGDPPRGGHIMSQDIVEAALLGREGWAVEWDIDPAGSFDELPANLITYGQRDRRWCQGNFQHFWLIFGDRMRWGHRFYFALGIMAYASSPLLLLLLSVGSIQGMRGRPYEINPFMLGTFLAFFLGMFLIPRLLAAFRRLRLGGTIPREGISTVVEIGCTMLMSPSLLYLHSTFVIDILCGRRVAWKQQPRDPNLMLEWTVAARLLWIPTIIGAAWLAISAKFSPAFLIFLCPVLFGWVLAIPVAVLSSSPAIGRFLSQANLLENCLSTKEKVELIRFSQKDTTNCPRESDDRMNGATTSQSSAIGV